MNKFEKWFINRILKREVKQSSVHAKNISNLYGMIRGACENEFTEDNIVTLNSFLEERFKVSLK